MQGKKVALFVAQMYDDREFWYPYYRMKEAGAEVTVIGPRAEAFSGKAGLTVKADLGIAEAKPEDYHALIIPGGYGPDHMRREPMMAEFVRRMHEAGRVVAAICHAGWMLASARIVQGKRITGFYSIKDDMVNAGAEWLDQEVVKDGNIITSRNPDDLPAFCRTIIETLA
ncbi:MAG: type 1 glutamine amidotransferase [Candidatus Zixiibacteriota bacterium]|nr:MAG: type 1 glutamine amidotransferase [candidate division Zixibacteria bacterium]